MATAPILPLAWEPPNAVDATLKRQKTKKNMCVCEVPIVAHGYLTSTHEDTGLISGLTLSVKDPVLLGHRRGSDWILHCCGCGGGQRLQL